MYMMKKIAEHPQRFAALGAFLVLFLTVPLSFLIVFIILGKHVSPSGAVATIDITSGAVQTVHQNGVPHTDIAGNFKSTFDSNSYLPIGIYNPTICQVSKQITWTAPVGYVGEYRVRVNYGSSRAAGTYLLADINTGSSTTATVGNLPPNSSLYYSVWKQGTTEVVAEQPFVSSACITIADDQNMQKIASAGFNTAILEKNIYPDTNVLQKAKDANLKLLLDLRDKPSNTFLNLKDDPTVAGFYVGDDDLARVKATSGDVTAVYNNLKTFADSIDGQTQKVVLGAEPDISPSDPLWWPWYQQFDKVGNVSFHYNYPKSNSALFPWQTISGVADTVKHQVLNNGDTRPSWFIKQAINLKWVIPLEFPTAQENKAMAYTALIHGATGLFDFSYDGWFRRQPKGNPDPANINKIEWYDRHAGIKDVTPASYPGGDNGAYSGSAVVDKGAYDATAADIAASQNLWKGIDASQGGLNKELNALKPVILSPTATDSYKVFVDAQPYSAAPVRTILKKYMGLWYLIAVNVDNAQLNARFSIPGQAFEKAEVMFEGRNVALAGSDVTDAFGAFGVHVYKLTPTAPTTLSSLVLSQRKVCSLMGATQTSAGIGGQDGGTSVKIGNDSFWTFGDTQNLAHVNILSNNMAKVSAGSDAGTCLSLTPKTNGSTAAELLPRLNGQELTVWPDGMVSPDGVGGYFYYMSVRACKAPEPCTYGPLGSIKVQGIGLAKFDPVTQTATRIGDCTTVANCLFWKEQDGANNGFEIAGATATVDNGYVYIYLNESPDGLFQNGMRIARVPVASIEDKSTYQYLNNQNGTAWVASLKDSSRIMTFANGFNGASVSYNTFLGKWTAVYTTNNFNTVAMKVGVKPYGPWSDSEVVLVDCKSMFAADSGYRCYFGRQHPEFAKNNGQTIYVSYANQNSYQTYLQEIVLQNNDTDGDGTTDVKEIYIGTDPLRKCGSVGENTWPPDVNNDLKVNSIDLLAVSKVGSTNSDYATYKKRYDVNGDGYTNSIDLLAVAKVSQTNDYSCLFQPSPTPTATPSASPDATPTPSPLPSTLPSPTPSPLTSPSPSPTAQSCTISPSILVRGASFGLWLSGLAPSGQQVSIIGAFGSPIIVLGNITAPTTGFVVPTTAPTGLYRVRVDLGGGTFLYCNPNLTVN
jgi:hypothetical protein